MNVEKGIRLSASACAVGGKQQQGTEGKVMNSEITCYPQPVTDAIRMIGFYLRL
jgi:hypothetical protein